MDSDSLLTYDRAVVMTVPMGAAIFISAFILTGALIFMYVSWWISLICVAAVILLLDRVSSYKVIFDNDGITEENNFCFLGFTIRERSQSIRWSAVYSVDYKEWVGKYERKVFYFHYTKPCGKTRSLPGERYCLLRIFTGWNKSKEGLEYAFKKLSADTFEYDARYELVSMGIWK